uniref:VP2 n=1 Tax=Recovirus Bangladesh/289/2007 TaxID=1203029 RepID=I6TC09_9CALI|nr:VP2 [Recovirus Bangladesh/289/2007]
MAGAAFATGLGQASGGILGGLIQGAIQAGLNEQVYNHNVNLAKIQHGYDLALQQNQFEHNFDYSKYVNDMKINNFRNAGFSDADSALLSRGGSTNGVLTTVRTPTGAKLYARNASLTSNHTFDHLIYQGVNNIISNIPHRAPKQPSVYNWQVNPMNYDTLSNFDNGSISNLSLSSLSSQNSTLSSNSIGSWGSYMDRHFPLE